MKTSTTKTTFFNRVANGDLTNKDQLIIFGVLATIATVCVILFGHTFKFKL